MLLPYYRSLPTYLEFMVALELVVYPLLAGATLIGLKFCCFLQSVRFL